MWGFFFWYERALTKFTVLALPAIGTFTRVGPVGVEANTASLTRKIDTFVDICEKTPYILTILFYVVISLYALKMFQYKTTNIYLFNESIVQLLRREVYNFLSVPTSQCLPIQPAGQLHRYDPRVFWQVPPLEQGVRTHSSKSERWLD